ncbi:hypothetical protein TSUD_325590 [Trifolium subterraneum]|uniref:Uncharacterized protein n=1 Tax=Trifolium subterraneum TaxID=3900 RepID=A0A2Z6MJX8_TRISU|nr:hypothetical protein TSUD_325590 [Trifolium subterraneum]
MEDLIVKGKLKILTKDEGYRCGDKKSNRDSPKRQSRSDESLQAKRSPQKESSWGAVNSVKSKGKEPESSEEENDSEKHPFMASVI